MFSGKDFTPAKISEVQIDSPAQQAGLKKNDLILSINGNEVKSVLEVPTFINTTQQDTILMTVLRNDQELSLSIKPKEIIGKDNLGNDAKKIIGIKISPINNEFNKQKLGPATALFYATKETWFVTKTTMEFCFFNVQRKSRHNTTRRPYKNCKNNRSSKPVWFCSVFKYYGLYFNKFRIN